MIRKIKTRITGRTVFILCLIFIALVSLLTAQSPAIIGFTDLHIFNSSKINDLFSTWQTLNLGQSGSSSLWRIFPLDAFYYPLNYIFHIPHQINQAIFLAILNLTGFLSFNWFMRTYFKEASRNAIILGGLLYVFNVYNILNTSISFAFAIVYVLLPLQLTLLYKSIRSTNYWTYIIYLAFVNLLMFGVNLAFSAISVSVVLVICIWEVFITKEFKILKTIFVISVTYLFTLFMILWWLIPMIYSSLTDAKTTSYVLNSENFNGLDSTASNIFRFLGDWSFFGSYKNLPYHRFADSFKNNGFVLLISYIPTVLILLASSILFKSKLAIKVKKRIAILIIFIVLLIPIIGNTNNTWPTASIMSWIFTHVPYSMVFRSTYKFMEVLVFCYVVIVTLLLSNFLLKKKATKSNILFKYGLIASTLLVVIFTGYPLLTNSLYENKTQITKLPDYWDFAAKYVNSNYDNVNDRTILLPDQYFPAFVWNGEQKSLPSDQTEITFNSDTVHGTCKGCAPYYSAQDLQFIYQNLGNKNIANYLGQMNISHILQRDDFDYGYYNQPSPFAMHLLVNNMANVSSEKTIGPLKFYSIDRELVNNRIYSPDIVTKVDSLSGAINLYDYYRKKGQAFITNDSDPNSDIQGKTNDFIQFYNLEQSNIKGNEISQKINLNKNKTLSLKFKTDSTSIIKIDDTNVSVDSPNNISKGSHLISTDFIKGTENLIDNGSFEDGPWQDIPGNCFKQHTYAQLNVKSSKDHTDGKKSVSLSANQDTACIYSSNVKNFSNKQDYIASFDYKITHGKTASYCLWDGTQCLPTKELSTDKLNSWQHIDIPLEPTESSFKLVLYLYAPATDSDTSEVEFDNVSINTMSNNLLNNWSLIDSDLIDNPVIKFNAIRESKAKYNLSANIPKQGGYLVFNEAFNPSWKINVTTKTSSTVVDERYHFVANGFSNGWFIDSSKLPSGVNLDDVTITMEYVPQKSFYIGLIISGITLSICIGYLVYINIRRYMKRLR